MDPESRGSDDFDVACRFLNALAAAMQRYGVSSHAMQTGLARAARALSVEGEFLATPAQVQSILWKGDEDRQRTHITLSRTGNYDLTKLVQVTELVSQVEAGAVSPEDGLDRIQVIDSADSRRSASLDALAFALCAVGFGVILGISWRDALLGAAVSLLSFGMVRLASNSQGLATVVDLVAALVAASVAGLLSLVFPGSNQLGVTVCAVIWFVPGFGLTLGANELMIGNTLSGLIGFTDAAITSVKLLAGALIGSALVRERVELPLPDVGSGIAHIWTWLFVPVFIVGLAILFRVRSRDLIWPMLGGLTVWVGVEFGSGLGFWQGTFLGALILRLASGVFTRQTRLPSAIVLLPVVMLLVPGLATLNAFYVAETQGLVEGLQSGYRVVVLVAAILGGLLVGDAIWSVRRPRFPPLLSGLARSLRRSAHDDASIEL